MAGLVKCKECGGNYSVRQHKNSGVVMFCARSKRAGNLCTNTKSMPMPIIEEFRRLNQLKYVYRIMNEDIQLEIEDSITKIDGNIKDLIERRKRVLRAIELSYDDDLSARLKELKEEISQLESDKRNIATQTKTKFELIKETTHALNKDMNNLLDDKDKLNGMLKSVDFVITANDSTISIDGSSLEYLKYNQIKKTYTCLNESYEEVIINNN